MSEPELQDQALRESELLKQRLEVLHNEFLTFKEMNLYQAALDYWEGLEADALESLKKGGTPESDSRARVTLQAYDMYKEFMGMMVDQISRPIDIMAYENDEFDEH